VPGHANVPAGEQGNRALSDTDTEGTRRDFLYVATGAFAAIGAAAATWPLIDQMNPDASATALSSIEVDLEPIEEGQAVTVVWRKKPVFIRHRTPREIEQARATKLSDLADTSARVLGATGDLDASDKNRTKKDYENWLVLVGICTHLGCIPKGQRLGDKKGDYDGWFCPCHGSHYDTAGRIRKGPAPRNLDVPPYAFISDTKIKIG